MKPHLKVKPQLHGIGDKMVLLPMLRTKDNVDHVGHSQQQPIWKDNISYQSKVL